MWALIYLLAMVGIVPAQNPSQLDKCLRPPFHGITETAPDGTLLGRSDPNDWGCAGRAGATALDLHPLGVPVPPVTSLCFGPAYPNPALTQVRLVFRVPAPTAVRLVVYRQTAGPGRPEATAVRTVMDATVVAGFFEVTWDLRDDSGSPVPPGIYRAVLEADGNVLCGDIEVQ